jgi:hypothetical protein
VEPPDLDAQSDIAEESLAARHPVASGVGRGSDFRVRLIEAD